MSGANKALKRLSCVLALLAASFVSGEAAEPALGRIESACAQYRTLSVPFSLTRTVLASGKTDTSEGTISYEAPGRMALHFTQPAGEKVIINGNRFYTARRGAPKCYDTDKNVMMRSLRNTLLYCVQGRAGTVAAENNADISLSREGGNCVVTLSARKSAARGYRSIVLHYRESDCLLVRMVLEEFSGVTQDYRMGAFKKNVSLDASLFEIPAPAGKAAATR